MSDNEKVCSVCGAEITTAAAEGLCAVCLLQQAAFETEAGSTDSVDIEAVQKAFPQLIILEKIGRGGMGTVFKARQPKLDRFVALKILSSELAAKPTFADRFAREGKLLARLNHPNIVAVYDFGESGGFYFLLMEYVDGVNLRQAMREEKFTPKQAINIVPKICDALQYAHDEGVLHRDIKPENILLDTKGRVKIADFGIGKLKQQNKEPGVERTRATPGLPGESSRDCDEYGSIPGSLTQAGQILGTPSYMAPEQLDDPNRVDHRADIYSLGVVFYELLTGELPRGRFPLPSEKTPVGADVDRIVLKALQKERDKRQQSAEELKTEVETATHISSPPRNDVPFVIRAIPPPSKPPRRGCFGCLGLLVIGALAGMLVFLTSLAVLPMMSETVRIGPEGMHITGSEGRSLSIGPGGIDVVGRGFLGSTKLRNANIGVGMIALPLIFVVFLAFIVGVVALVFILVKQAGASNELRTPAMSTKFCTHCGAEQVKGAYACPKCGFATQQKRNYCFNCGVKTDPEQILCVKCGASLAQSPLAVVPSLGGRKEKPVAGLFALLLGWIGVHKFYLESWGWGVVYVLLSWTGITFIAGIIEGILFFLMDEQTFDQRYNQTQPAPFRW